MKSKAFINIILLFVLFPTCKVYACGYSWYASSEYYTFRVYDATGLYNDNYYNFSYNGRRLPELKSEAIRNCELWQKMTSANIPIEDIYKTVYKLTYKEIHHILSLIGKPNLRDTLMQNKFVEWLVQHKDVEIGEFLSLAKLCEETRHRQNTGWYYWTQDDDVSVALATIANQAKSYEGNRLKDRYALQAIRALFAVEEYDECINFWNDKQKSLQNGLLKEMIIPYIAGAYYHIGATERAMQMYAECGDIKSLFYCVGQYTIPDIIEQMELVYEYCPNSSAFPETIQQIIRGSEAYYGYDEKCLRLYNFALKVCAESKVADLAMWYYTAAYIANLKGDAQQASKLLTKAEKTQGSQFVKESIKVMRIYLDAKLLPYNAAYEQRLFEQLQWLDNKITNNIDEYVRDYTANHVFERNVSYYYWNDMLRKIILSEVAPRYIAEGNYARAIQLVNMADNRLMNIVDKCNYDDFNYSTSRWEEKTMALAEYRKSAEWSYDYSNALFELIDSIGVDNLIAYTKRLKQPRSAFDNFLNKRGYTNLDYFNEIIGTQCLREMRYADAVRYFEQVPTSFQYTLNTYKDNCMKRDPFANDRLNSRFSNQSDYKYNFAREMYSLEQVVKQTKDPNRKAQLLIRYATGIRNSINGCWALTQYYYNGSREENLNYWTNSISWKRANDKSEKLINDAFAMFTDDECAAQSYRLLGYNMKVVSEYPNTQIASFIRKHCDQLRDYKSQ